MHDVVRHRNIVFSEVPGFGPLHLDLMVPEVSGRRPLVVWIHGNGFSEGSRLNLPSSFGEMDPGFYDRLTARGFALALVDYRLSGDAKFPAQLEDVQAALAWLHGAADDFNLDVGSIALWGDSAGAVMASLAALEPNPAVPVHAVVDWYGPTDLTAGAAVPGHAFYELVGGGTPGAEDRARAASPVHQVRAGAPPFLIMHGTDDDVVFPSDSKNLAEALRKAGVRADHVEAPGWHVFIGNPDIGALADQALDFLDEVLALRHDEGAS